jgi:hypothetical protein
MRAGVWGDFHPVTGMPHFDLKLASVQKIPAFIADPARYLKASSSPCPPTSILRRALPFARSCRKISYKLRPLDMEITSEIIYWAVLLYVPIYWFIGLIVLGGCFIAGTIWSVLRHALIMPPSLPTESNFKDQDGAEGWIL